MQSSGKFSQFNADNFFLCAWMHDKLLIITYRQSLLKVDLEWHYLYGMATKEMETRSTMVDYANSLYVEWDLQKRETYLQKRKG